MAKSIDPQRRGLRFHEWPEPDREAWEKAIAVGNVFDGRGPAAHWSDPTKNSNKCNYGRWLAYLMHFGQLDTHCEPQLRVTPELVARYVDHLQCLEPRISPRTVVTLLVGLKVTIMAMAPESEWRWLKDVCNALNRISKPSIDKQARLRSIQEMFVAAIRQLEQLRRMPMAARNLLCAYRDTLMIGFMAARPLRRRNLAGLRIGVHMKRRRGVWHIEVPHYDVKNRRFPLEFDLPPELVPFLDFYIDKVRSRFLRDEHSDHLWISWEGTAMSAQAIYSCLSRRTQELLGTRINPHLFRDCAASSLALESPEFALAAAPLLGHSNFATTQRHYVQARQIDAGRKLNDVLNRIKEALKE
jgi:hypothetical protein